MLEVFVYMIKLIYVYVYVYVQKGVGRTGGPRTFFYTVTGDTNRRQPLMIYVTPVGFEPGPPWWQSMFLPSRATTPG